MRVRNLIWALLFFIPVSVLAMSNGPVNSADKNDASVVMNDQDENSNDLNLEEGATDEWRGWGRGGWGRGWGGGWGRGFGRGWGGWGGWGGLWGGWGGYGLGSWYGGLWGGYSWPYSYGYYSWPYYGGLYW
jgi:hypothetical protein